MLKESDDLVILGVTIFAPFTEQLLNGFVFCGTPGKYSMIDCFLGDAIRVYVSFGVLFCGVVLDC